MKEKQEQEEKQEENAIKIGQSTFYFGSPCPTIPVIIFDKEGKIKNDSTQPT